MNRVWSAGLTGWSGTFNMRAVSREHKSTALDALGPATVWSIVLFILFLGNPLRGDGPVAVDDQARTVQNTPISIAVLANDSDAGSNQMAILQVTSPAHGKVTIN